MTTRQLMKIVEFIKSKGLDASNAKIYFAQTAYSGVTYATLDLYTIRANQDYETIEITTSTTETL